MSSIQEGISNLIKNQRICLERNDELASELMQRVNELNTVIREKETVIIEISNQRGFQSREITRLYKVENDLVNEIEKLRKRIDSNKQSNIEVINHLMFTKQQIIDEKSRGAFNDPNQERIFRLNLLNDWLIFYDLVITLESHIRGLESEAQS